MLGERIFSSAQPFPLKLHRIRLNVLPLVCTQNIRNETNVVSHLISTQYYCVLVLNDRVTLPNLRLLTTSEHIR